MTHLRPWLILLCLLMMVGCQATPYQFSGGEIQPPIALPDVTLTDMYGQPFHLSDYEDGITLVYFGYTFCPDVCPLTLWDVKKALEGLEGRERVQTVFISVDPERDTPEALQEYLAAFDPTFIGLTDDRAKVETVLQTFGAFAEKEAIEGSATQYLVNHTARLYLVAPHRQLRLTYPFGFTADELRADLTYLLD